MLVYGRGIQEWKIMGNDLDNVFCLLFCFGIIHVAGETRYKVSGIGLWLALVHRTVMGRCWVYSSIKCLYMLHRCSLHFTVLAFLKAKNIHKISNPPSYRMFLPIVTIIFH